MTTSKFMMEVEGLNKKLSLHYHNSQNKDSSLMSACFIYLLKKTKKNECLLHPPYHPCRVKSWP